MMETLFRDEKQKPSRFPFVTNGKFKINELVKNVLFFGLENGTVVNRSINETTRENERRVSGNGKHILKEAFDTRFCFQDDHILK